MAKQLKEVAAMKFLKLQHILLILCSLATVTLDLIILLYHGVPK